MFFCSYLHCPPFFITASFKLFSCRFHNKLKVSSFLNTKQISKIADPEIHDVVVQSKNMSNEEEIDSEKLKTEIESPDLEKATEESALVEEKSDDVANLVPVEGQIEEIEIGNKKSIVAPESIIESVTGPEEKVSQAIETNEEPSDKHIVGEVCFFIT